MRNEPKKILFFHRDSDVATSFLNYVEGPSNRGLYDQHNKYVANFKKKACMIEDQNGSILQCNYDWKIDPCKLAPLKNCIDIIPVDTEFIMLDFNKIRKTRQKI